MMRWILLLAALALLAGCGGSGAPGVASGPGKVPTVAFVVFGPDPATERAMAGVKDGLKAEGYEEGKTVRFEQDDAQGEMTTVQSIAQKFVSEGVDVIVPLTTPCLVSTASATKNTDRKVVFTEVYDPFAAGVAKTPEDHLPNLTGVCSPPPVGSIVDLLKELVPGVRRIGIVYNPAEANSVSAVTRARKEVQQRGLALEEKTINGTSDIQQAAKALVGDVDAFMILGDNTVNLGLEALVGAATAAKLPVVVADPAWIDRGVLAAMGPDFYEAGKEAAKVIAQVLKGADPGKVPIKTTERSELSLNRKAALKLGLKLPESLVKKAGRVVE